MLWIRPSAVDASRRCRSGSARGIVVRVRRRGRDERGLQGRAGRTEQLRACVLCRSRRCCRAPARPLSSVPPRLGSSAQPRAASDASSSPFTLARRSSVPSPAARRQLGTALRRSAFLRSTTRSRARTVPRRARQPAPTQLYSAQGQHGQGGVRAAGPDEPAERRAAPHRRASSPPSLLSSSFLEPG